MQPPNNQPLQARGHLEEQTDLNPPNNLPILNSPAKPGLTSYIDTAKTVSQLPTKGRATLPVDSVSWSSPMRSVEVLGTSSHEATNYVLSSAQRPRNSHMKYGSPAKNLRMPERGTGHEPSMRASMEALPPMDNGRTTFGQLGQKTTKANQHAPHQYFDAETVLSASPHVPVTKQLNVQVPSGPLSCPSSSPFAKVTAPSPKDFKQRSFHYFQFEGVIDDTQLGRIQEVLAEKHQETVYELERRRELESKKPFKLQDPPLLKSKRRLSFDADNAASPCNSSKTASQIKNKSSGISFGDSSYEPLPVASSTPEGRKDYKPPTVVDVSPWHSPTSNPKSTKSIQCLGHETGNSHRLDSKSNEFKSPKPSKSILSLSPRQGNLMTKISPRYNPTSHRRHPSLKTSREPSVSNQHSRYGVSNTGMDSPGRVYSQSADTMPQKNNGVVSRIPNDYHAQTSINITKENDLLRKSANTSDTRGQNSLNVMKEQRPPLSYLCQSKEGGKLLKVLDNARNGTEAPVFDFPKTTMSPSMGCDEVDGMDMPMDCDDEFYPRFIPHNNNRNQRMDYPSTGSVSNSTLHNRDSMFATDHFASFTPHDTRCDFTEERETHLRNSYQASASTAVQYRKYSPMKRDLSEGMRGQRHDVIANDVGQHPKHWLSRKRIESITNSNDQSQRNPFSGYRNMALSTVERDRAMKSYKTDARGRIVIEPEQVEDASTDIVGIFGSDEESPNSFVGLASSTFGENRFSDNGYAMDNGCHVVSTQADTNVQLIDPRDLSDSSSMSCENSYGSSDNNNSSLQCGDCGPESKHSRAPKSYYDETDGGNFPKENDLSDNNNHTICTIEKPNWIHVRDHGSYNKSLLSTSCNDLNFVNAVKSPGNTTGNTVISKSKSCESILSENAERSKTLSSLFSHGVKTNNSHQNTNKTPDSPQSFHDQLPLYKDGIIDDRSRFKGSIMRTKTYENLTMFQPKFSENKRYIRKPYPQRRVGGIRSKELRRKQAMVGFGIGISGSSSLPRRSKTANCHLLSRQKKGSHSMDDLLQEQNYRENEFESDDDGLDEVDGLGDDDGDDGKSKHVNTSGYLKAHEDAKRNCVDDDSDVVHCFDDAPLETTAKANDIVSCFGEQLNTSEDNSDYSEDRYKSVDKDNVIHCFGDHESKINRDDRVPCLSDETDGKERHGLEERNSQYNKGGSRNDESKGLRRHEVKDSCPVRVSNINVICKQKPVVSEIIDSARLGEPHDTNEGGGLVLTEERIFHTTKKANIRRIGDNHYKAIQRQRSFDTALLENSPVEHVGLEINLGRSNSEEHGRFHKHLDFSIPESVKYSYTQGEKKNPILCNREGFQDGKMDFEDQYQLSANTAVSETVKNSKLKSVRNTSYAEMDAETTPCLNRRELGRTEAHNFHRPWLSSPPRQELETDSVTMTSMSEVHPIPNIYISHVAECSDFSNSNVPFTQSSLVLDGENTTKSRFLSRASESSKINSCFNSTFTKNAPQKMFPNTKTSLSTKNTLERPTMSSFSNRHPTEGKFELRRSNEDPSYTRLSSTYGNDTLDGAKISKTCTNEEQKQCLTSDSSYRHLCEDPKLPSTKSSLSVHSGSSSVRKLISTQSQLSPASPLKSNGGMWSRDVTRIGGGRESSKRDNSLANRSVIKSTKNCAVTQLDFGQMVPSNFISSSTSNELPPQCIQPRSSRSLVDNVTGVNINTGETSNASTSTMYTNPEGKESSGHRPATLGKHRRPFPEREKDEIDVKIKVTDVMAETRDLGKRLEEIYQANHGDCECARVEQEILQTALDLFGKMCAAPETQTNFSAEVRKTKVEIERSLEIAASLRQLCRHGRRVSDVLKGSVILRMKCKTLMGVLDLCHMHESGELQALLLVILGMRSQRLRPGLTLRVTIDVSNVNACLVFLRSKLSLVMRSYRPIERVAKKKSPSKRVVRSTENLLSSPSPPASPTSVSCRWSSTPVLPTRSPLASPMYTNAFPAYIRERKFSFGDATRNAFQELNISDAESPSSPFKEENLQVRPDAYMKRLFSPSHLTSPRRPSTPSTSPLTSPMRLKRRDVIQEQENIANHEEFI